MQEIVSKWAAEAADKSVKKRNTYGCCLIEDMNEWLSMSHCIWSIKLANKTSIAQEELATC